MEVLFPEQFDEKPESYPLTTYVVLIAESPWPPELLTLPWPRTLRAVNEKNKQKCS